MLGGKNLHFLFGLVWLIPILMPRRKDWFLSLFLVRDVDYPLHNLLDLYLNDFVNVNYFLYNLFDFLNDWFFDFFSDLLYFNLALMLKPFFLVDLLFYDFLLNLLFWYWISLDERRGHISRCPVACWNWVRTIENIWLFRSDFVYIFRLFRVLVKAKTLHPIFRTFRFVFLLKLWQRWL